MLRTINNNISLNRGESATIDFVVWNNDGTPYILPPLPGDDKIQAIVAFTMYTADGYAPVLTKYLDMFEGITSPYYNEDGDIQYYKDTNSLGYNKFTSQQIYETDSLEDFYTEDNRYKVCAVKDESNTWQYYYFNEAASKPLAYEFGFSIVLTPEDTAELPTGDYRYDVSVYIGEYLATEDSMEVVAKLPLVQPVMFKQQLVSPHKFSLEDSLNV